MLSAKWPKEGPFGWACLRDGFYGGVVPDAPNGDWSNFAFVDWQELVASLGVHEEDPPLGVHPLEAAQIAGGKLLRCTCCCRVAPRAGRSA